MRLSPGCPLCSREQIAKHRLICTKCEAEQNPSPLRHWREITGTTIAELVEDTGLSKRTLLRADAGERMSHDAAIAIAKRTGLHWRELRPKEDDDR